MRRVSGVWAGLALAAAGVIGCSGGDSARDDDYVDALADVSLEDNDVLTADAGRCLAQAIVDAVGVDKIAAKVSPSEIREAGTTDLVALGIDVSAKEGETYYEHVRECVDVRELFVTAIAGGGDVAEEAITCLDENLSEDLLKDFVVASFTEGDVDPQLENQVAAVLDQCTPG